MIKTNNHLVFPTLISQTQHSVSNDEKETWFDLYLKNSDDQGFSQDFLGFENIQTESIFQTLFMKKLKESLNEYFKCLSISLDKIDIQLTKCFFNVTDQSSIPPHDHSENHLTFTYYPYIANGKERNLMFYNFNEAHTNEPYPYFFRNYVIDWNDVNSNAASFPVTEGTMFIFPSKLKHCIEAKFNDREGQDGKSFKSKEELKQSRFCVSGDMLYTKKENINNYNRALSNPKNWRTV